MILGLPGGDGRTVAAQEASENAAVVRAMYRALEGDGDATTLLERRADPQVAWVHPMVARMPFDGTRRGLQTDLRAAFRRGTDGTGPRVSAQTFLEFGDGVLVVGRFLWERGEPFMHECFVRGGKVVLIREYPA